MIFTIILIILFSSLFSNPWGYSMYGRPYYYRRRPMFGPMFFGPTHHHHGPHHMHGPHPGHRHF